MFKRILQISFLSAFIFVGAFFCWQIVYGETINVDMNVPSDPPPCSNCGGAANTAPAITNIVTSTSYTIATTTWTATDNDGIASAVFNYGTDTNYSQSGTVTGNYQNVLTTLTADTLYYYRITVTDNNSSPLSTTATGTFRTLVNPQLPDTTPPTITNVSVLLGVTTATIKWNTNELATSEVNYYINLPALQQTSSTLVISHTINLSSLLPNTTYNYQIISADGDGNSTSTSYSTFKTNADIVAPAEANNFNVVTSSNSIDLTWTNPSDSDFAGVNIRRTTSTHASSIQDGVSIYTGSQQSASDTTFLYNTLYYYTIFTYDTSNNYSNGVFRTINYISVIPAQNEICDNGINDNSNPLVDCADPDCVNHSSCQVITTSEICTGNIDEDKDGLVDCDDSDCTGHSACVVIIQPQSEICTGNIDEDKDGLVDCADPDCTGYSGCIVIIPPGGVGVPACNDGLDNDTDGLIDYPSDPGCDSGTDTDEYNPPSTTVPSFIKLDFSKVKFFTGNGKIQLTSINSVVTGLSGTNLIVLINKNDLPSTPSSTIMKINGSSYILNLLNDNYQTKINFPSLTTQEAYLEIDYGSNQFDSLKFKITGVAYGDVVSGNDRINKAVITLFSKDGSKINLDSYGQINPYQTNSNGIYGWMVPNGQYYIEANQEEYYQYKSSVFFVSDNIINTDINLIIKPKKIEDIIDPNASITENTVAVVKNLGQKAVATTKVTIQKTKEIIKAINILVDDPKIEQAVERTFVPASVGVVAVGAIPFLTLSNLLPLLRLLFLQPLMLLGWNRRRKWGLIYNSLNKMPIDLAMVRLIDNKTGRLIQSKVTDRQGRYYFIASPGEYRLEIHKGQFIFPSILLKDYQSDGRKTDVYHGETIRVTDNKASIIANIPLDPVGEHKKPTRLIWARVGRIFQHSLSIIGIIVTILSFYISPKWYIAVLLLVHILLYLLFRRLAAPTRNKSWGIVYDDKDKKPIGRAVARLFNTKFNKLVATQVTDRKGRYQFLAGDDDYYVTYNKQGYEPLMKEVDLKGKEDDVVDKDVGLNKK